MKIVRVSTAHAFADPLTGRPVRTIATEDGVDIEDRINGVLVTCVAKLRATLIGRGNVTSIDYVLDPPKPPKPKQDPKRKRGRSKAKPMVGPAS